MPKYCILRVEKLNHEDNVRASLQHAMRERETTNAQPSPTQKNAYLFSDSVDIAMEQFQKLLPKERRKNAVLCLEYVATVSKATYETMTPKERLTYFQGAVDWLKAKHGANVFHVAVHNDETVSHISAFAVPLDARGKLNARSFTGGRKMMSDMQTDFHEKVGAPAGLDRGIKGSKARHETVRSYYGKMAKLEAAIKPPKRNLFEKDEDYENRYMDQLRPIMKIVLEAERIAKRNAQLEEDMRQRKEGFKELRALTDGLTEPQKKQLWDLAKRLRLENQAQHGHEQEQQKTQKRSKGKGTGLGG